MTHAIRMKNFHGDILWDDPENFVDDIQFLADTWYGNQTDDAASNGTQSELSDNICKRMGTRTIGSPLLCHQMKRGTGKRSRPSF